MSLTSERFAASPSSFLRLQEEAFFVARVNDAWEVRLDVYGKPSPVGAVAVGILPALFRCHLATYCMLPISPVCTAVSAVFLDTPPDSVLSGVFPFPWDSVYRLPRRSVLPLHLYFSSCIPPLPLLHATTLWSLLFCFGQRAVDLSLRRVPPLAYQCP